MGMLKILDHTGDTVVAWDVAEETAVEGVTVKDVDEVCAQFNELLAEGKMAYEMRQDGSTKEQIREFNPDAHTIIMAGPYAGG